MDITLTDAEKEHSSALLSEIAQEIASCAGWIPFSRYMEMALYQPGKGYYSAGAHKLGAGGDFTTAPEISPFFGITMTNTILPILEGFRQNGLPTRILEFGAGTGKLAESILNRLHELDFPLDQYDIIEISPDLAQRQAHHLQGMSELRGWDTKLNWLSALPNAFQGVLIANEVLDAIPCELIIFKDGVWRWQGITIANGSLSWETGAAVNQELLPDYLLSNDLFPDGYITEIHPQANAWMSALCQAINSGLIMAFDYGFPDSEYYHPQRQQGTLMAHHRHHAIPDPFHLPGLCDLTSHVEWSSIAQSALNGGSNDIFLCNQAAYLLEAGIGELVLEKADPANPDVFLPISNALQKLLSEAEMGELFKVFACSKNLSNLDLSDLPGLGGRNRLG